MDTALRAAERTYASDPTPEHRAALKAERARAGCDPRGECDACYERADVKRSGELDLCAACDAALDEADAR